MSYATNTALTDTALRSANEVIRLREELRKERRARILADRASHDPRTCVWCNMGGSKVNHG